MPSGPRDCCETPAPKEKFLSNLFSSSVELFVVLHLASESVEDIGCCFRFCWSLLLREDLRRTKVGVGISISGGGVTGWLTFGVV